MYSALYFPHTEVRSLSLVKTALLTWDRLETIAPFKGFQPHYGGPFARAMELIGAPRAPTEAEQRTVHGLVEDLIADGIPETFTYQSERPDHDYEIWPGKLAPGTWELLWERGLVGRPLPNSDYPASQPAGLTLMSIIADVLAGETRARITDRGDAYATIANAPKQAKAAAQDADLERVVPLTFKTIALEHVPLEALIAMREREVRSRNSHEYRQLRHAYLDRLTAHVKAVASHPPGTPDRVELDRVFEQAMDADLATLRGELGVARNEALLSKEMLALVSLAALGAGAFAAGGALAAAPLAIAGAMKSAGVMASIGGPLAMANKFGAARRKVMRAHPMAYLYEIDRLRR